MSYGIKKLRLYEITDFCPEKLAGYAFFALGDHPCSREECRRNLINIYKTMVLGEKFEKYVRIR